MHLDMRLIRHGVREREVDVESTQLLRLAL